MSEQERFREIGRVATDATAKIIDITRTLVDKNVVMNDLSELAYQLGRIRGLSYVPKDNNG